MCPLPEMVVGVFIVIEMCILSCIKICKEVVYIVVAFYGRILCNPLCLQHSCDSFLIRFAFRDFKRNTAFT